MDEPTLYPGDRVALLVPGSHAYVDAVLRMLTAAVFPIPLDPRLTPAEQERISPASTLRSSYARRLLSRQ